MTQINEIINQVKLKYAPDKRVAIFNVQAETSGSKTVLKGETNIFEAKDELLNRLKGLNITASDEISRLPSKELGDMTYGIINLSVASIRTGPDHPAEMATQALLGCPVKVYKKSGGWYLVQTPDMYIAWAEGDAVKLMNQKEYNDWMSSKRVVFWEFYGSSLCAPGESSSRVSDLVKGDILKLLEIKDGFCKVEYPDKRTAYIPSKSCIEYDTWLSTADPTEEKLVETAKTFMGIPYLWGGTSVKGVDCSGFTKQVCFFNGILLPRDASQQVNAGEAVNTDNGFDSLRPGDLLFFGTKATATTKEKTTHVAMYIGNGEFIHSSGMVRINSLDKTKDNFSAYRFNQFLRAKRILNSLDKNGVKLIKNNKLIQR